MPEPQRSTPLASAGPRDVSTLITPLQTDRYPDDDLDLRWYGAAFARRWVLLLCGALLGALVAVVAVTLRPVMYEGSTTLLVAPPPRAPTSEINPATFRAILENASLVSQVIAELNLSQPPHLLTTQRFLESSLNVEELRGTNVVKVKVRLRDPKVAANASRGLAQKAILLTRQLNQQEGLSVQEQLKGHVDDAATRLRRAEQDLLAYQQHAQVELLKEDTQAILGERGDMLKLIISIESEKARLQAALDEIKRQDRLLPAQRAVGAEQALRRQQQESVRRQEQETRPRQQETRRQDEDDRSSDRTADPEMLDLTNAFVNPVYQTLDFQIATSRARLAALEQQRHQLVDVRKLGGDELTKLSELYRRQIELARLQTQFDLAKRVYSDLMVRYEESRTQPVGNSPQLQLVDEAIPPDRPVSRRRAQWAALGFSTGLFGAALVALILESRTKVAARGSSASR